MNPKSAARFLEKPAKLVLWVVSGLAMAGLFVWVNVSGIGRFGLGWTVKPGFVLLVFIILVGAAELRTIKLMNVLQIVLCLISAMLFQNHFIPRPFDSFIGIALSLMGSAILFDTAPKIRLSEATALLISSYIQSVYIYNLVLGEQNMVFFGGGWTL